MEGYFELSFYKIDWCQWGKEFYSESVNAFSVVSGFFFHPLMYRMFLMILKKMHVANEDAITFNDDDE